MTITRVHYRERQLLTTVDLATEQAYRIDLRRRHNVGPHDWGIVEGLQVTANPLAVNPGFAIDGYGRELIVADKTPLPSLEDIAKGLGVDDLKDKAVDIWLLYARNASQVSQIGRFDCGAGKEGSWREGVRLGATLVEQNDVANFDPRRPPGAPPLTTPPASPAPPGPHIDPPDDPAIEWPVRLCRIDFNSSIDLANRPLVVLRGQALTAPSGRAKMQLDAEVAGDRVRFGVFSADATGTLVPQWTVDRRGNTTIQGDTGFGVEDRADGTPGVVADATIGPDDEPSNPARLTPSGLVFGALPAPKEAASPWQIYCDPEVKDPPEKAAPAELRFELAAPAGKGQDPQFAATVGSMKGTDNPTWSSCLQVTDDCKVLIAGNLRVAGAVNVGPIDANPFDPRFQAALLDYWLRGLLGSTTAAKSDIEVKLTMPAGPVEPGTPQSFSGTVENKSVATPNRVSDVQIFAKLENAPPSTKPIKKISALDKGGGPVAFTGSFKVPSMADGPLNLQIDVVGTGMTGMPVKTDPKTDKVDVAFAKAFTVVFVGKPDSVNTGDLVPFKFKITNNNHVDLTEIEVKATIGDTATYDKDLGKYDVQAGKCFEVTGTTDAIQGVTPDAGPPTFVSFTITIKGEKPTRFTYTSQSEQVKIEPQPKIN